MTRDTTGPGQWSGAALRILGERYLARRTDGTRESPEDMLWRVSLTAAGAERRWGADDAAVQDVAGRFHALMAEGAFLPNTPTLINAGRGSGLQYSACYVLAVEDSMEGIFDAIKKAALIHKSGGGTGFSFSRLRPRGSPVHTTGGQASGPVSFLRVFDAATEAVKQGGVRRGANMGMLRVDHPDIIEFVEAKLDGSLPNFNLSVAATDRWMEAVRNSHEFTLVDHLGHPTATMSARGLFERMAECAWRTGDPGLVFMDRVNRSPANPTPELALIEATNPCGEQPLAPDEACNLGSLNLARFVRPGPRGASGGEGRLDHARLAAAVDLAVRFLDDVIEVNPYPLPEIDACVKGNRRIGLGIMGWADLLLELGLPYAGPEARQCAEHVMQFVTQQAHRASEVLAVERGAFPNQPRSIHRHGPPRRNATVTTIAPTGTISIIADCSSGIEPFFGLAWRHVTGGRTLEFTNPGLERVAREEGFWSEALAAHVLATGSVRDAEGVPPWWKAVLATAHEIPADAHVGMQAAFQKWTDSGVSKTINLPSTATPADVCQAWLLAYDAGCLGITVFRDGCRSEQVLHAGVSPPSPPSSLSTGASQAVGADRAQEVDLCPDCGQVPLVFQEGCQRCPSCDWGLC